VKELKDRLQVIIKKLQSAESIVLTTHKQCDGDGLGALLGLYHTLKKLDKDVRAFTVDEIPKKYNFLKPLDYIDIFEKPHNPLQKHDLSLIFDTNDSRLVEPLYSELELLSKDVLFIDHHPILNKGNLPTPGSFIDTSAASTGEISFNIIKGLKVDLDKKIARALYTSIAFDTQLFRYVKKSPASHLIAAEILQFEDNPEEVHESLFATYSPNKVSFLADMLNSIEYFGDNGEIAVLKVSKYDLEKKQLEMDDSRDLIDMIMNINTVQLAALFRQDESQGYKISLRSRNQINILPIAEHFNGGGHKNASGAFIEGDFQDIKKQVVDKLLLSIKKPQKA
jgi:phosphoesterase RecJ-like protein